MGDFFTGCFCDKQVSRNGVVTQLPTPSLRESESEHEALRYVHSRLLLLILFFYLLFSWIYGPWISVEARSGWVILVHVEDWTSSGWWLKIKMAFVFLDDRRSWSLWLSLSDRKMLMASVLMRCHFFFLVILVILTKFHRFF